MIHALRLIDFTQLQPPSQLEYIWQTAYDSAPHIFSWFCVVGVLCYGNHTFQTCVFLYLSHVQNQLFRYFLARPSGGDARYDVPDLAGVPLLLKSKFNSISKFFVFLAAVPIRQPYQTRYKLPLMNWSVLRNQQLRNTIFVGMNDEKIIESLDMDRFEELFRLSSNSILSKAANEGKSVINNGENASDSTTMIDGDVRNSVTSKKTTKKRLMDASRLR